MFNVASSFKIYQTMLHKEHTLVPKSSDCQFMATLGLKGKGILKDGDNKRGKKGYQCFQNYHLIEGWILCAREPFLKYSYL